MNYIVKISWYSGGCELLADKFFPTTLEKTRKLFKLLVTDPAWSDEQVNELLDYFGKRKVEESEKAITTQFKADHFKEQAEVIKKKMFSPLGEIPGVHEAP